MPQTLVIRDNHLQTSAEIGLAAFASGAWPHSGTDEFLAVLALRIVIAGSLVGTVERSDLNGITQIAVKLDDRPVNAERKRAAQLIFAPLGLYADLANLEIVREADDVGAVPLPLLIAGGVVQVSLIAGGAYVLTYVAKEASAVVDGALRRNSASKAVQAADAQALQVMNTHVQREKIAGKLIEFDAVERGILNALQDRISNIVKQAYSPANSNNLPPWVVPVAGVVGAAAVVSALYFLLRSK